MREVRQGLSGRADVTSYISYGCADLSYILRYLPVPVWVSGYPGI